MILDYNKLVLGTVHTEKKINNLPKLKLSFLSSELLLKK
jgi:hypothetical protein